MAALKKLGKIPGARPLSDGCWEAIRVVPADCVAVIGTKNLTKRCGSNYAAAVKAVRRAHVEFDRQIALARSLSLNPVTGVLIDPREAMHAIEVWRTRELQRAEHRVFNVPAEIAHAGPPGSPPPLAVVKHDGRQALLLALSKGVFGPVNPFDPAPGYASIEGFDQRLITALSEAGVHVPLGHPALRALRPAFQRAWLSVLRFEDGLLQGNVTLGSSPEPAVIASPPPTPTSNATAPAGPTLTAMFESWSEEHLRSGGAPKTVREFKTQIDRFSEIVGDKPVNHITRKDVITFKERMLCYPAARAPKAVAELGVEAVISWAGENDKALLTAKTLNEKVLAAIRAVLNHAANRGDVDQNHADNVRVKDDGRERPRLPYTVTELSALFASPVFSAKERPHRGAGDAAKWIPLLGLFTGARLEEIARLSSTDIKSSKSIAFIHLQTLQEDGAPRRLKNKHARRKVPIHSALIELGFLEFVETCSSNPGKRLFPLVNSRQEQKSAAFSKWYGEYARLFVPDRAKCFHSFRHNFKFACRDAGIAKELYDSVMGHAPGDVAERYGLDEDGQGYSLPRLRDAVEAVRYSGLDLTGIA